MERKFMYKTKGTCSSEIMITLDGKTIKEVSFFGGCSGNTQGVAILCKDKSIDEITSSLSGIRCGFKATSCPDQLARALKMIEELPEDTGADGKTVQINF